MNTLKKYRIFFTLICLTLAPALTVGNVNAQTRQQTDMDFAAVDAFVSEQMDNLGIPGLALGIIQNGQIVHLGGFGVADSTGRSVTPQTPFYIGSITKSFTALAVMQLVEEGKIDLDSTVQTYLPWFELADKEASARITVRHLLNQTTGISTRDGNRVWTSQLGLEDYLRGLNDIQLTQPVGATYQYCNINFMVAGLIVEVVSGESYAEYISEHIFQPLEMRHSYVDHTAALPDGLAEGHIHMFGRVFSSEGIIPPANIPTGHLITSAEDLSHFAMTQMDDGQYGETSILSPQGITEMHAPAVPQGDGGYWGIGWDVTEWEGKRVFSRVGDAGRNHATLVVMPESDLAVILLANASGFDHMKSNVVDRIARGVFVMLHDYTADPVSVPFLMHFFYWLTLLIPLFQIFGILFVWRNHHSMKIWGVLLTVALNLAVVFFIISLSYNEIPLSSLAVFFPEVGYGSIVIATLGIGWSAIFTVMNLRMRFVK